MWKENTTGGLFFFFLRENPFWVIVFVSIFEWQPANRNKTLSGLFFARFCGQPTGREKDDAWGYLEVLFSSFSGQPTSKD